MAHRQLLDNQGVQGECQLNQTMAAEMTLSSEAAIAAMVEKLPQAYQEAAFTNLANEVIKQELRLLKMVW